MSAELVPAVEPRRTGLGGGDIGAVVGVDKNRTPWDIWAYKRGLLDKPEVLPEYMTWGSLLERPILEEYARREEATDLDLHFNTLFRHPERDWQIGHPDGERVPSDILVEAKTVGFLQAFQYGEAGTDQIPERNILQAQWYLSLRGRETAHVVVLVGGQELRTYTIFRNRALEDFLLTQGERFWRDHVLADTPPAMGDSEAAEAYLKKTFPRESLELRPATGHEYDVVKVYAEARARAKEWGSLKAGLENQLKSHIGGALGIGGDDWKITWKKTKDGEGTDWEAVAKEAIGSLQLIAGATESVTLGDVQTVARSAFDGLIPKHTKKTLGYRRFLPSGRPFKEEENGTNG